VDGKGASERIAKVHDVPVSQRLIEQYEGVRDFIMLSSPRATVTDTRAERDISQQTHKPTRDEGKRPEECGRVILVAEVRTYVDGCEHVVVWSGQQVWKSEAVVGRD
jgi:hypothetical protein